MSEVGVENFDSPTVGRTDPFMRKLSAAVDELYITCEQNRSETECSKILQILNTSVERFEKLKRNIHTLQNEDDSESNPLRIITNFRKKLTTQKEDRDNPSDLETVIGSTPLSAPSELSDANVTNSVLGDDAVAMLSPTNMSHSATFDGSKSWADYDSEGEIDFSTNNRSQAQRKSTVSDEGHISDIRKPQKHTKRTMPSLPKQFHPTVKSTPFGNCPVVENFEYYSNQYFSTPNPYYQAPNPYQVVYPYYPGQSGALQTPLICVGNNLYSTYPAQLPYTPVLNVYPQADARPVLTDSCSAPNILTRASCIDENLTKKVDHSSNSKEL